MSAPRSMVTSRQHVVSLVAVFLALAVGIALGGGPLGDVESSDDGASGVSVTSPAPGDGATAEYADAFAEAAAGRLYANGLDGHAVAVLALPGAETAQIKLLNKQIVAAGGAITATFAVGEALLDPDESTLIDTLGAQLTTRLGDPRVDATAPTYERMGQLIALAIATDELSSIRADQASVIIREGLEQAGLLTSPAIVRNAPLVLAVLPPGQGGASVRIATRSILAGLVNGIAANASGIVVTGSADSAELAALRESELTGPAATVDGVDTGIGRVTTVLALESVLAGTGGSYGASGSDGPVPLP